LSFFGSLRVWILCMFLTSHKILQFKVFEEISLIFFVVVVVVFLQIQQLLVVLLAFPPLALLLLCCCCVFLFFFFRVAGVFSCCSNPFLLYCADYPDFDGTFPNFFNRVGRRCGTALIYAHLL
jgi:hypothetical protein